MCDRNACDSNITFTVLKYPALYRFWYRTLVLAPVGCGTLEISPDNRKVPDLSGPRVHTLVGRDILAGGAARVPVFGDLDDPLVQSGSVPSPPNRSLP